jgi:2-polyprenyl-3-methyl-5-hydroxy-6-metoxy-1,4-benzoquinol methylase
MENKKILKILFKRKEIKIQREEVNSVPHDLSEIQKNWDELGRRDPLYAIKVGRRKEGGEWESKEGGKWDLQEFFQTGTDEIDSILNEIDRLNLKISHTRALDFGCGIGRVTQSLPKYFENVDGVDIAPSMIELANTYNKYKDRVHYYLNNKNSLEIFQDDSYDFIYSVEVLQHMHPRYQENYLCELLRILSPEGILVFELPSEYENLKRKIFFNFTFQDVKFIHSLYWKNILRKPSFALMQYYCNPRKNVEPFLLRHGAKHVYAIRNSREIISYNYFVTKY